MRVLLLALVATLAACDADVPKPDQCLRQQLFQQCLASLPAGPAATKYNDWSEVVSECSSVAYYHSLRLQAHIKPECLAN